MTKAITHIQAILGAISDSMVDAEQLDQFDDITVELEQDLDKVDPDKFNRANVLIDGSRYAISVFVSAEPGTGVSEDEDPWRPIHFIRDYRQSNPKLHQLYVGWARETIQATTEMCRTLWDQSRWPASSIAHAAWAEMVSHIKTDAAWFEAAALEFMSPGGDPVMDDRIYVGESIRNLPPGNYTGIIQERGGKLYFELPEDVMTQGD